jgi:hypothetical protein
METAGIPPEILDRQKAGTELRARYELYFVTVIFTFAGLAIQTAKQASRPLLLLEIGAWICFLVSGLVGLWRVSRLGPREFGVARMFETSYSAGDITPQAKLLTAQDGRLDLLHKVQWYFFIAALLSVGVARAGALWCA